MRWIIIGINLILSYIFMSSFLPRIGIITGVIYVVISVIGILYLKKENRWVKFVNSQIRPTNGKNQEVYEADVIISVAFLALGMKIGTFLGLAVTFSMVLMLTFCILLVSGYIIEGRKSGITIKTAWDSAKIIIWVFNKINGIYGFIAEKTAEFEFEILKIAVKSKKE